MKTLLRRLGSALVLASALLAPWTAIGLYNNVQITDASAPDGYGFLNNLTGNVPLMFNRADEIGRWTLAGVKAWAFDEKHETLYLADLGTASSALLVSPTTGIVTRVDVAWGATLSSANAVMAMYRFTAATARSSTGLNQPASNRVTAFAITAPTTYLEGGREMDDAIFQAVNQGDVLAVDTNGGPANVVPAWITITIRPSAF